MPRNNRTVDSLGGNEPLFLPKSQREAEYAAQVRRVSGVIAYSHLPIARSESRPAATVAVRLRVQAEYNGLNRRYDGTLQLCRIARIAGDDAAANAYHEQAMVMYERLGALYQALQGYGSMTLRYAA